MNRKMYIAAAVTGLLMLGSGQEAMATPITTGGGAGITVASQTFTFTVADLPEISPGQDATFSIWAEGDFSPENSTEYLTWDLDGTVSEIGGPENGGTVTAKADKSRDNGHREYNQVAWNQSWTVDYNAMSSILNDGSIILTIDLSDAVNKIHKAKLGDEGQGGDFLLWELSYDTAPVPEPATMLLMTAGLAGLGVVGRKKKLS